MPLVDFNPLVRRINAYRSPLWNLAAVLVGISITIGIFYPGFMSFDSVQFLIQARQHVYLDFWPPFLAWIWHFVDRIIPGPLGMLLILVIGHWTVVSLLNITIWGWGVGSALASLSILLWPAILSNSGVIWTDNLMSLCLLAASLMMAFSFRLQKPSIQKLLMLGSALLLCWGVQSRHNGFAAVFPLLVLWVHRFFWQKSLAFKLLLPVALVVAFLGVHFRFNQSIVPSSRMISLKSAGALFDLTGMSLDQGEVIYPTYLRNMEGGPFTLEELRVLYNPSYNVDLFCCSPAPRHLADPKSVADFNELIALHRTTIFRHPISYLRHRTRVFAKLIGMVGKVHFPYMKGISDNPWNLRLPDNYFRESVFSVFDRIRNSVVFRPWYYLLASIVLAGWAFRRRQLPSCQIYLALFASQLLYTASFYFLVGADDFRYMLWTVFTTLFGLSVYLATICASRIDVSPKSTAP